MDHQAAVRDKLAERYLLQELSDTERDTFEEHYFTCELCAEDVRLGSRFIQASRLELAEPEARRQAVEVKSSRSWFAWLWTPAPAYALAMVLCAALVLQRGSGPSSEMLALNPVNLRPVTRGAAQVVKVQPDQKTILLNVAVAPGASYECTASTASGNKISAVTTPPVQGGLLTLALPAEKFRQGQYRLTVRSRDAAVSFEDEFDFTTEP